MVYERELKNNQLLKVGVNNNLDISLLYKRPLAGFEKMGGTIASGACISGLKDGDVSAKHGFELAINL